jgi:hypothetical protein
MNTTVPDRENHNCKHRDVYVQTHKGLLWTSTFTDNHICSHRYAWPCVWTQAHKQTHWHRWGILAPWLQKCSQSTGLTNICSILTFIWKAEAKSAFLDLFYSSFLYTFPNDKIYWLKLAFCHQTLSVLKIMPEFCPSWRQTLKMLQPALPIPSQ